MRQIRNNSNAFCTKLFGCDIVLKTRTGRELKFQIENIIDSVIYTRCYCHGEQSSITRKQLEQAIADGIATVKDNEGYSEFMQQLEKRLQTHSYVEI